MYLFNIISCQIFSNTPPHINFWLPVKFQVDLKKEDETVTKIKRNLQIEENILELKDSIFFFFYWLHELFYFNVLFVGCM